MLLWTSLLGGLLVAGLTTWFVLRSQRGAEVATTGDLQGRAYELLSLSWEELDALLREAFERRGFRVFERGTGGGPATGLADLVLERKSERWLVSAKYWREATVAGNAVRELYGAMVASGASGGFILTSGGFGPAARVLAQERQVELLDGRKLTELIEPVRQAPSEVTRVRLERAKRAESTGPRKVPCPQCGKPMQRRQERLNTGGTRAFYACGDFPRCRGRREIG